MTGSGISHAAGVPTFSDEKMGWYRQAAQDLGLKDGQQLFRYTFHQSHSKPAFQLFTKLWRQTCHAHPTRTHRALAELMMVASSSRRHTNSNNNNNNHRVMRHYTMNIDGLASHQETEASIWNETTNPNGNTVEWHGTLHELWCRNCQKSVSTQSRKEELDSAGQTVSLLCEHCGPPYVLRYRVLLYDEQDANVVSIGAIHQLLEADLRTATAVVWMGISFEQSASCEHFAQVQSILEQQHHKRTIIPSFLVNPTATEALEALQTAVPINANWEETVYTISMTSDELMEQCLLSLELEG